MSKTQFLSKPVFTTLYVADETLHVAFQKTQNSLKKGGIQATGAKPHFKKTEHLTVS